jgi:hypothetical protein
MSNFLPFYRTLQKNFNSRMATQVQVIYDFAAEPGSNELSITTGDLLTVTNWDAGDGWWEGTNSKGK